MFCIYSNFNSVNLCLIIWVGWPVFTKLHMNVVPLVRTTKLFLGAFAKLQKYVCLSVWNTSLPQVGYSWNLLFYFFFFKSFEKLQVWLKPDENNRVLYAKTCVCVCTYVIISGWVLRRTRNLSQDIRRENQDKHFVFSIFFYENRAVYKIMWKNMLEADKP